MTRFCLLKLDPEPKVGISNEVTVPVTLTEI